MCSWTSSPAASRSRSGVPTARWRSSSRSSLRSVSPRTAPGTLDLVLNLTKLLDPNEREVKRHLSVTAAINEIEPELKALDDAGLRARSDELRKRAIEDRKSTRLNSSHRCISYAVFCL